MALDKSIKFGKEHRKPYHGNKAVDSSCRNHGSCPHCKKAREYKLLKQAPSNTNRYCTIRNRGV